ncbi:hypothetical protein [Zhongshania sp.]|uniref:hypothetical protein n=1 Tax=Zhongshania sp. TaxID=1971902 RepID=UPI00356371A9
MKVGMCRIVFAAIAQAIALVAHGLDTELSGVISLQVYPTAPVSGLATGATAAMVGGETIHRPGGRYEVQYLPLASLLGSLPPAAGVDIPGIRRADEYSDALVDYDPQAEPQSELSNGGGCWVGNLQSLSRIEVASRSGEAWPSSLPVAVNIVCMQASTIQLIPMQAGREVRAWSAVLVKSPSLEPFAIEIMPELVPGYGALVDNQFQTQPEDDALHRVKLAMRVVVYTGNEFQREYPRRGGYIDVRDIAFQIKSTATPQ